MENILEELDAANEFYFDKQNSYLYFYPNTTSTKPDSTVVVPALDTLISITGSQDEPVVRVTLSGLEFTATRPTYMDARTNPSGGDWALERYTYVVACVCAWSRACVCTMHTQPQSKPC